MNTVAKHYFSHFSIWTYIIIGISIGTFSFSQDFLMNYWYMLLSPIIIAPFFEWGVHKYILHAQIGNVVDIDIRPGIKIGDKLRVDFMGEEREMEVLKIKNNKMEVGYGWTKKLKFIRDHMHILHYGHHADPNYIPLVFAPISSVLIMLLVLFLSALLFSFNLGIACVFLLGVIIYYLHYEWMHLGHHILGYNHIFPWSNQLKTAHQLHHFLNENYWWGITNNIGDKLLGTYKTHKEVIKSKTLRNINHK